MARWRLIHSHYLDVPGTEWEYKEVNQSTGKQGRKIFNVHRLLDPTDPSDQNYPGEVIVCHEGKGDHRDIVFVGPPTPDMEPLDAEAKKITAEWEPKWRHPIESLPSTGFSQSIISDLEQEMQKTQSNTDELASLRAQVAELREAKSARR